MSIILNLKHFPDSVRCNLILTKCLPILLYGLDYIELSKKKSIHIEFSTQKSLSFNF